MAAAAVREIFVGGWQDRTWATLAVPFPQRYHVRSKEWEKYKQTLMQIKHDAPVATRN